MAAADCYSVGEQVAAQYGGTLAKASQQNRGGQTVCVIVVLVPGKDGQRPRRTEVVVPGELSPRRPAVSETRKSAISARPQRHRIDDSMRILVVEDDKDLNRQLSDALADAGYVVDRAYDGEEGHFLGDTEPYDAVVLDIGLPQMDGISVVERWRRDGRKMPVLILTARDRWSDKVAGIDAGADDYVTKPFHIEEVLARVRALIRRAAGHASSELTCGPLRLDTKASKADVNGVPLKLTSHEFRLLAYLMHHMGEVVSRTELVEHLYDQDFDRDSNTIEVFVGRLRKKMGIDLIETVRGMGYRMREPEA